jgi:hypothetical protein
MYIYWHSPWLIVITCYVFLPFCLRYFRNAPLFFSIIRISRLFIRSFYLRILGINSWCFSVCVCEKQKISERILQHPRSVTYRKPYDHHFPGQRRVFQLVSNKWSSKMNSFFIETNPLVQKKHFCSHTTCARSK